MSLQNVPRRKVFWGGQSACQPLDKFVIHLLTTVNQESVQKFALICNEHKIEIAEYAEHSTFIGTGTLQMFTDKRQMN